MSRVICEQAGLAAAAVDLNPSLGSRAPEYGPRPTPVLAPQCSGR